MNQLNSLIIEGNVVNDKVEVIESTAGFQVAEFSVGVNRYYKNANNENVNEVSFFDIKCYGVLAKYAADKCVKGRTIRVVGRLKQERWVNDDNVNCSKIYVVAEHLEFMPIKKTVEVKE